MVTTRRKYTWSRCLWGINSKFIFSGEVIRVGNAGPFLFWHMKKLLDLCF